MCVHHNHVNSGLIRQSHNQSILTLEKRSRRVNEVPSIQFSLSEDTIKTMVKSMLERFQALENLLQIMTMTMKHCKKINNNNIVEHYAWHECRIVNHSYNPNHNPTISQLHARIGVVMTPSSPQDRLINANNYADQCMY